jgi:cell volume regulation protein A
MQDDTVVLSGPSLEGGSFGYLTEIKVDKDSEWPGRSLSEIKLGSDKLVILIKRGNKAVIPGGRTVIKENDVLIINQS